MEKMIKSVSMVLVVVLGICGAIVLTAAPKVSIPGSSTTSNELIMMDDERAGVSSGRMFMATRSVIAATQNFGIKTGSIAPRMTISVTTTTTDDSSTYLAEVQWKETVTFNTSTGTEMTRYNLNRQSSLTSTMVPSYSPAVVSTSTTTMPTEIIAAGKANYTAAKGENRWPLNQPEWILKKNTQYWFQITPSNSVATFVYKFVWKE